MATAFSTSAPARPSYSLATQLIHTRRSKSEFLLHSPPSPLTFLPSTFTNSTQRQKHVPQIPQLTSFDHQCCWCKSSHNSTTPPPSPLPLAQNQSKNSKTSKFTSLQYSSECRVQTVSSYLNDGVNPARNAVCQQDDPPFDVPLGAL